jgi:hypothetical protein
MRRAVERGDPTALAALAIARTAEADGADLPTLLFVLRLADIAKRYTRVDTPVLQRDPGSGAYTGSLPVLVGELRATLPALDDAQLSLAYDTLWQAMQGSFVPPRRSGLRSTR